MGEGVGRSGAVGADGVADASGRGFPPTDAGGEAAGFQAQEGAQGAGDMVALRAGGPDLRPLDAAVLLETPVVDLDAPGELGVLPAGQRARPQVARRPVFPVPVWGDDQE